MACERGDDAERYKLMFFLFLANKRWPFWNRHTHFFYLQAKYALVKDFIMPKLLKMENEHAVFLYLCVLICEKLFVISRTTKCNQIN